MIILPSGETLIWKAVDISDQRGRAIDVIPKIEEILNDLKDQSIKVAALVSDSAAAYASARQQLRLKYPQYVFLPCFAHQCNLAVGEIFKESSILKNASTNAVKLVNYFNHPNNVYFIGKLRNIQRELYSKYYAIIRPGDTRWNSYYECYLSLIRTKQALRNLVTRYEPLEETSSRSTELYLPTDICQIIMGIISRLEKRWNDWEQPILLLSLVLHPKYRLNKFNPDLEIINFVTMGTWLDYYYKAWTSEKPTKLLAQFESYQVKKPPFNNETYEQFGDDVLAYWYYCSTMCKELGFIATKIFSICVNSASHERVVNITPPIIESDEQETGNTEQNEAERILEDLQETSNYITTEQDWTERLNEWNELLMEEERAQNLNVTEESLNCSDNDLLNSYIHPAINADAKWNLRDLFIRELERPEFISVSSEFN
ncbi:ribonuclease H-like domain-containing protein [Rhizophagus irregularis DAOM 181602=DAOM 197198]|nr:ribonuclease H-like domain-containing protein [Rhizophagus irregularis DAOM 181602=DAOM 197198]